MLTDFQIDNLLTEGRGRRNPILLLQARAAIVEHADAIVKASLEANRGFTEGEDARVSELLKRAEGIKQEVAIIQAEFEKAAPNAHPVRTQP